MATTSDVTNLVGLTQKQLTMLANDFRQPDAVQAAAKAALKSIVAQQLRNAINSWASTSSAFSSLTQQLLAVTDEARKNPGSDGVAQLVLSIRKIGDLVADVGGFADHEPPPSADGDKVGTDLSGPDSTLPADVAAAAAQPAPPIGTVKASTKLAETADEYLAMFQAATIDPAKQQAVDRWCDLITANEAVYHRAADDLGIPWHFVGIIHSLEAACNFGCHLHNGDPLTHRTTHVPAGRPDHPDPPFAWWTSANDALVSANLNAQHDWSLPAYLWRLEGYNGRGCRKRGLVSAYLWSFTDRYVKGKYVADGVFDSNAVSKQCGGVAILKTLVKRGTATL